MCIRDSGDALDDEDGGVLRDVAQSFRERDFFVWSRPRAGIDDLCSRMKAHKARHGLDVAFVDYIGLIRGNSRDSRYEQVSAISGRLKGLAGELGIPIVCLCQINRSGAESAPGLHHLRDSGAIEQDADKVILLHRADDQDKAQIIIAKNRFGPKGVLDVVWDQATARFLDQIQPSWDFAEFPAAENE